MTMKKLLFFGVLCVLCASLLLGCGGTGESGTQDTAAAQTGTATLADVASAVTAAVSGSDGFVDAQESYISTFLKATAEDFAGYKILVQSNSSSIDEIGIFEVKSADEISTAEQKIDAFFALREAAWDSTYLETEHPKLMNAERVTCGNFVMYVILGDDDRAAAITAFENAAK